jgi:Concanavalin A-like lectin/glucanases superfamily
MALYPAPLTAILGAIAALNKGVTLDPSLYTFGAPTPFADPQGVTNTSMLITVAEVTAPYQGSQTVYYTRLNLSDLTTLLPQPIAANGLTKVSDFWAILNANFGLNFVAGDLNDNDSITVNPDGSGSVTLIAQANSQGWIGTVTMSFVAGNFDLATTVGTTALPGFMYPNQDLTKPFGELYSYWRDMSAYQSDLQNINTSTSDLTTLTADLKAVTGDPWVNTAASRFSLQGAAIVYNGPVVDFVPIAGTVMTPNTNYVYVLVVQLGSGSLGYGGYLFLHYVAIDPFGNADGTPNKTVMLLHFNGINGATAITDNANPARTFNVVAPAAISTVQSAYGGSSLLTTTGGGDVETAPTDVDLSGQFTMECMIYLTDTTDAAVIGQGHGTNGLFEWAIHTNVQGLGANGIAFYYGVHGTNETIAMTGVQASLNAWHHLAASRDASGNLRMFLDGVLIPFTTFHNAGVNWDQTKNLTNAQPFFVGGLDNGYVDEFRLSNVARYTATFTPPSDIFYVD